MTRTGRDGSEGSRGVALLGFVFGVADATSLPGPAVVRLLGDLGMSESATRSLLARLRRSGDLAAERHGRLTTYTLDGAVRVAWERGHATERALQRPPWDGTLHGILWSVPESLRPFRDRLRHLTRLAGYAPLNQGLFISAQDRWPVVADQIGDIPDGARVCPLELRMRGSDAAAATREAWRLDELGDRYRALTARLEGRTTSEVAPSAETLRRFQRLTLPVFDALVDDPGLPPELLPEDWPLPTLVTALHTVLDHYAPALDRYTREVRRGAVPSAAETEHA